MRARLLTGVLLASVVMLGVGWAPAQSVEAPQVALLTDVQTADLGEVDRVTFFFERGTPEVLEAAYFSGPAVESPSGELLEPPLLGDARLRVTLGNAFPADLSVDPIVITYTGPDRIQPDLPQVVDLAFTEQFEATVQWTIGLRGGEVPIAVQVLAGPTRVVVDIPHVAAVPVAGRPSFTG